MKTIGVTLLFTLFLFPISAQTLLDFEQSTGVGEYFEIQDGKLVLNAPKETGKRQWYYVMEQEDQIEWSLNLQLDFSPSNSNYVECYLMADSSVLTQGNAYILRWGMSGSSDVLQFYHQKEGSKTKLAEGTTNLGKGGNIDVKIIREETGKWQVYLNETLEIETQSVMTTKGNYIGLICAHTSTRYNLFSFDNFSIQVEKSTKPPIIDYHLHDIVFTEILVDEEPQIFLPRSQYIELYNRTDSIISLVNWSLEIDGKLLTLPNDEISPKSYVVVCLKEYSQSFVDTSKVVQIDEWEKLGTQKGNITLWSPQQKQIDQFVYNDELIDSDYTKAKGGWSLERQDVNYFCDPQLNWKYSQSPKGGTPTYVNSIDAPFLSSELPQLEKYYIQQSQLHILFNKSIAIFELESTPLFLDTIIQLDQQLILQFDTIEQTQEIELVVEDCQQNQSTVSLTIGPAKSAEKDDVFVNEILINPFEEGSEFVELYNPTNKFIQLSSLVLGTWDEQGVWKEKTSLPNYLLQPHSYVVLTNNKQEVINHYTVPHITQIIEIDLPVLTNEGGTIVLATSEGEILETIQYHEDLHATFLSETKGVSLERESIDCLDCWQSASETTGWASPTYENSQQINNQEQISLQSSVISPGADQQNDQLVINYEFEEENWKASFHVFSKNGYKITTFEDQTYLGRQGTVSWDLKDEAQQMISVGFYVLIVELYNEKGEVKKSKIPFVIAL